MSNNLKHARDLGRTLPRGQGENHNLFEVFGTRYNNKRIKGQPTGEFRPPIAGEFYLRQEIVLQADEDMTVHHHIIRLVRVKRVWTLTVEGFLHRRKGDL